MKNDEEKQQHSSESPSSDSLKTSSSLLVLQQLNNKETEKKEAAAEALKVRCRACFKELAPTPRCFGHGGGGGGGEGGPGGSSSEEKTTSNASGIPSTQPEKLTETKQWLAEHDFLNDSELESLLDEQRFDSQIIEELIAKELLLVDNDRESMTLSIKLQCKPNLLTKEQQHELKKFMEAIIKEFNEFKKEHRLSNDCIKIIRDEKGNILSLRLTMPTLALYDAFIQRLANNLVPSPSPKIQEEDKAKNERNSAPNPFSMEPKPSSTEEKVEDNEEGEQKRFNPSPFNMKPW